MFCMFVNLLLVLLRVVLFVCLSCGLVDECSCLLTEFGAFCSLLICCFALSGFADDLVALLG